MQGEGNIVDGSALRKQLIWVKKASSEQAYILELGLRCLITQRLPAHCQFLSLWSSQRECSRKPIQLIYPGRLSLCLSLVYLFHLPTIVWCFYKSPYLSLCIYLSPLSFSSSWSPICSCKCICVTAWLCIKWYNASHLFLAEERWAKRMKGRWRRKKTRQ